MNPVFTWWVTRWIPFQARDMIKELNPDVRTLDVEMPKMDGLTFLKNLMRLRPMPVVMLSSLTSAGAQVTLDALEAGAVDFMHKVQPGSKAALDLYMQDLVARVKQAAKSQMKPLCKKKVNIEDLPDLTDCRRKLRTGRKASLDVQRLVAIGASTVGPEALRHLLTDFDSTQCALVIAQHMPEAFMEPFAEPFEQGIPIQDSHCQRQRTNSARLRLHGTR